MWIQVRDMQKPDQCPPDQRYCFDAKVNGVMWRCLIDYNRIMGDVDKQYVASCIARAALVRFCQSELGEGFLVPCSEAGHYTWQQHNSCTVEASHERNTG